ncbi:hypothetical protein SAMN05216225_10865 [Ornithinibacillus halophilus]|uniref:Uncharacterized protein n=1 Tax=Ornithinibacillus halophilus TaxID=930117 RepID=A0A1M5NPC6_9BACI|nr:hypothetical protein SAMN05216225_10865 [Ornithinibacillus halophilus]
MGTVLMLLFLWNFVSEPFLKRAVPMFQVVGERIHERGERIPWLVDRVEEGAERIPWLVDRVEEGAERIP